MNTTIIDIFNKFDVRNQQVLGFLEFRAFCDVIGKQLTEEEFRANILDNYMSSGFTKGSGLLVDGLK
jgi:hypothetical protein